MDKGEHHFSPKGRNGDAAAQFGAWRGAASYVSSIAASDGSEVTSPSSNNGLFATSAQAQAAWLATERVLFGQSPGPSQQVTLSMLGQGTPASTVLSPRDPQSASARSQATLSPRPGPENAPPSGYQHFSQFFTQQSSQKEQGKRPFADADGHSSGRDPTTVKAAEAFDGAAAALAVVTTPRSSSGMTNSGAAAAMETDLAFGSHRITVVAPPVCHQRIDLFADGTVLTMSRPVGADQQDLQYSPRQAKLQQQHHHQQHLMESGSPSGRSVFSSSPAALTVLSPPPPHRPNAQAVPSPPHQPPGRTFPLVPSTGPIISPAASAAWGETAATTPPAASPFLTPSLFSTPAPHIRPSGLNSPPDAVPGAAQSNPFQQSQPSPAPSSAAVPTHIDSATGQHQHQYPASQQAVPVLDASPRSYTPLTSTLYTGSPYGAPPSQYGAMVTPMSSAARPQSPAHVASPSPAQTPPTAQAFGSEQANSPPDVGCLFALPTPDRRSRGGNPHQRDAWATARSASTAAPPPQPVQGGQQAAGGAASSSGGGIGIRAAGSSTTAGAGPGSAALSPPAAASSSQAQSGSAAPSGPSGDSSGTSPGQQAARDEEQSQKLAYLAAFHEDRERWEEAAAERQRALRARFDGEIAAVQEEHQRLWATASAQHEADLQEARAAAAATAEAANALVQRARAQAQAAADAAEAAVLEAKVQMQLSEATAAQQAKAAAKAAKQAAEAAAQRARTESQAEAQAVEVELQAARAAARAAAAARGEALREPIVSFNNLRCSSVEQIHRSRRPWSVGAK